MSNGHRWSKFWWQDWQNEDTLRACCLAAQGLWMRILCIAHNAVPYGHLLINGKQPSDKQLAGIVGAGEREIKKLLAELETAGVYSRQPDGTIYCRRMVKDAAIGERARWDGLNGGNPEIIRGTVAKEERQRRFRRSDSPEKTNRIFAKSNGCCHWCSKVLQRETPGHDFFHVDHIVAVRDGGGIDEDNLVAACAECNHNRARHKANGAATSDHKGGGIETPTSDPNGGVEVGFFRPQFRPQPLEADTDSDSESKKEREVKDSTTLSSVAPGACARTDAPVATVELPRETVAALIAVETITEKVGRKLRNVAFVGAFPVHSRSVQIEAYARWTAPRPKTFHINPELLPSMPHRQRALAAAGRL